MLLVLTTSCARSSPPVVAAPPRASASAQWAAELARELALACPPADPGDESAREACAAKLAALPILRDAMAEPFLWGGQSKPGAYDLEASHLTRFAPYAWRRMYLSTFMFSGEHSVEEVDGRTVVHLAVSFRNALDPGAYPYPFWHSEKKWRNYQAATLVHLIVEDGRVKAAMRGADVDDARTVLARRWDSVWRWSDGAEPRNTLFANLFSKDNPHVGALETAYRDLEDGMRPYNCTGCHAPNNPSGMNPLELLVYPNQALAARRAIVEQLEKNTMPPETHDTPPGIGDDAARERLLGLARRFQAAADEALRAEGEPLPALTSR
jgi:hypothetical protein